ncbi:class I SAM-dependent methyltransferase [Halovenus rubra]|uniref:Class I SAM-dependent methyltransferase n=2 Tax=Halovenus rubra TaxID=869890 RepID=A0ABD5X6V6_9EURY|nr:class I SAM-dependent methyltransferase [Halovenus rubra]
MTHWTEEMFVEHASVFERTMHSRVEEANEEVEELLDVLTEHDIQPETALDVACGIGRHTVEFATRGLTVRGIDISTPYVESARERAEKNGVADSVTVEVGDMRELDSLEGTYDLVTNMWTAFGYFDEETNEAVAAGFRNCVAEDGALVMELSNKEFVLGNYSESSAGFDEDILSVERNEYCPTTGRMETKFALFEQDGDGYEFLGEVKWDLRVYAPAELRQLLERAGFGDVHLYGGVDGTQLKRDSNRLMVIAEP